MPEWYFHNLEVSRVLPFVGWKLTGTMLFASFYQSANRVRPSIVRLFVIYPNAKGQEQNEMRFSFIPPKSLPRWHQIGLTDMAICHRMVNGSMLLDDKEQNMLGY